MALFKPYKITKNKLNSLPIKEGQFIIVTDTEEIYVDKSASERIKLGGGSGVTNLVNGSGTGSIKMTTAKETQGNYAFAEGYETAAKGPYSHAEGNLSVVHAEAQAGHAEGYYCIVNKSYGHAEGNQTHAQEASAHAEGELTFASGTASHAEGLHTYTYDDYSHVQGKYNLIDWEHSLAHVVGNGTSDDARSNAHTVDWDGNAWYQGNIKLGGTSYADATRTIAAYISGTTEPTSDIGADGDIYILIEE